MYKYVYEETNIGYVFVVIVRAFSGGLSRVFCDWRDSGRVVQRLATWHVHDTHILHYAFSRDGNNNE